MCVSRHPLSASASGCSRLTHEVSATLYGNVFRPQHIALPPMCLLSAIRDAFMYVLYALCRHSLYLIRLRYTCIQGFMTENKRMSFQLSAAKCSCRNRYRSSGHLCETGRHIAVFTLARYWAVSWASWISLTALRVVSLDLIVMLPSYLNQGH